MCTKQQLKNFLVQNCVDAKFQLFQYVSPEIFKIWIKCRVERDRDATFYNEYSKEWIKKFAKFTSTGWIVRNSFPNLKRLLYRKTFVCHLSGYNKKKNPARITLRNKDCRAKIDFKMKIINRNTIRNDKSLKEGLNMNIYIEFTHTHDIKNIESFNLLKCSSETDDIFYKYFSLGHSPVSAKSYNELVLMSKHEGITDENWSNSDINPPLRHILYIYGRKKIKPNVPEIIKDKIRSIRENGGAVTYLEDPYHIKVVITPFMKNVLLNFDLDNIIVESSPVKEDITTVLFVPTLLGALPIACLLHADYSEKIINQAVRMTKELIETYIRKTFEPKIIMANNVLELKAGLISSFPNAMVCTSQTSICADMWTTICNEDIKIESEKRHDLMSLFHALLYAKSIEEAEKYYQELESNNFITAIPKLKEHLNEIWGNRFVFISQNGNTIVNISLKLLKEFILCKCSGFNGVIMLDVLVNILDKHWSQLLLTPLKNRHIMNTFTRYLTKNKLIIESLQEMEVKENIYMSFVRKEGRKRRNKVIFRSDTLCCDCYIGIKGGLCEHLNAVLHTFDINIELTDEEKELYTKLAGDDVYQNDEDIVKLEPSILDANFDNDEHDLNNIEVDEEISKTNEYSDDYYFMVKEEIEDRCDPLEDTISRINNEELNNELESSYNNKALKINMKSTYEDAMKSLNNEFRRLNLFFKNNPNASNLDTMLRLTRELTKIKPVEKINLSHMYVEMNDTNK